MYTIRKNVIGPDYEFKTYPGLDAAKLVDVRVFTKDKLEENMSLTYTQTHTQSN